MPYNLRKRKEAEPAEASQQSLVAPAPKPAAKRGRKAADPVEAPKQETSSQETKPTAKRSRKAAGPVEVLKEEASPQEVKPAAKRRKATPVEAPQEETPAPAKPKPAPKRGKKVVEPVEEPKTEPKEEEEEAPAIEVVPEPKEATVTDNQLVFGEDTCGELGFKKIGCTKKRPVAVPLGVRIKQVACGPMHTLSLTESGTIYSYGCNDEGALGRITDGEETLEATPTVIEMNDLVTKITTGDSHGAALTDKNDVYIWGNFRDEHGSVGLLTESEGKVTYKPIQVLPGTKFKDIASGSNHMLLLDVDGAVYSFGVGSQGQLGRLSVDQVGSSEKTVAITAENRSVFLTPKKVPMKNVDPSREFICDAVYAGNFSSFATNTDKKKNRLAGWGLNNYFQLGYKGQVKGQLIQYYPRRSTFTCSTSMINVACGQHHTIFLTKTGRVSVAGRNEYGMLGLNKSTPKEVCPAVAVGGFSAPVTTICAGINTSFAVDTEGKLHAWGMQGLNLGVDSGEDLLEPTEVKSLADHKVISVSSGSSFTAVIVDN